MRAIHSKAGWAQQRKVVKHQQNHGWNWHPVTCVKAHKWFVSRTLKEFSLSIKQSDFSHLQPRTDCNLHGGHLHLTGPPLISSLRICLHPILVPPSGPLNLNTMKHRTHTKIEDFLPVFISSITKHATSWVKHIRLKKRKYFHISNFCVRQAHGMFVTRCFD